MKITINAAQNPTQDDIFKPGTLVQHKDDNWVILVTDADSMQDYFSGVIVTSPYKPTGHHAWDWGKDCFTLFVGNIVLEQS